MITKPYAVSFEIAGASAMFARPDTGAVPISYPAPTKSALKSMFEAVAMLWGAHFEPRRVELCKPIVYHKYTTNYLGPLRNSAKMNVPFQSFATVLENVCYKVYGDVSASSVTHEAANPQHALQEIFERRLTEGAFFYTPCLGWKEFTPSYFGSLREATRVDAAINLIIPSMLYTMYDQPARGQVQPAFRQDVRIVSGVLDYDQ